MLRAKATNPEGDPTFILGVTETNLQRLKQGQPIRVDLQEMLGPKADVVIIYGSDQQTLIDMMAHRVGPETKVHTDPRLADHLDFSRVDAGHRGEDFDGPVALEMIAIQGAVYLRFSRSITSIDFSVLDAMAIHKALGEVIEEAHRQVPPPEEGGVEGGADAPPD